MAKEPSKIGKYSVIQRIAQGGMGAVYLGMHPTLDRKVILKKLTLKGSSSIVERFKREARIMMDFKSDFIVDVYDHFKEGTSYYIVLEYIEGTSLDNLIKKYKKVPNDIALYIMYNAAQALQYAHNKNVIHRDIKPANILLSKNGEIKLVDFGIAVSQDEEEGLTMEGTTLGTPSYMAPEQLADSKSVDNRADIYSLGVMFYEMVTGKKPFSGYITAELIAAIQTGKYKKPRKLNPKVTPFIQKIIVKMMRTKKKRRYQDLNGLIDKIKKRLRRDRLPKLRENLIDLIQGKELAEIDLKNRIPVFSIIFKGLVLLAILAAAGFASIKTGLYHQYLAPKTSGKIHFELKYSPGSLLEGRYPVSILINYLNEKKPKQFTVKTSIIANDKDEHKKMNFFGRSGKYSIEVNFLTFNMVYNINLKSFKENKGGIIIPIHLDESLTNEIYVTHSVVDTETGEDITDYLVTRFYNEGRKRWVDPNTMPIKPNTEYTAQIFSKSNAPSKWATGKFKITIPEDVNKFVIYRELSKKE